MRLRYFLPLLLVLGCGMFGLGELVRDAARPGEALADIGGGRSGARGPTGPTGPTGPNWTTCAELASSMTNEVGTCGSLGGPLLSASPTTTGTLTVAGISGVTGTFGGALSADSLTLTKGVSGATGVFSGALTAGAITSAPASANAITATAGAGGYGVVVTANSAGVLGESITAPGNNSIGLDVTTAGDTATGIRVTATNGSGGGWGVNSTATLSAIKGTSNSTSASFSALHGIAASGAYCALLDGDETSPIRALIGVNGSQDANPSGTAVVGDLTPVTSNSVPIWRVATATTPTFQDVAGLLTVTTGLTAFAGGGQASATAVCAVAGTYVVGTVGSAADSVKLPATPVVGQLCEIVNDAAANAMNLFPGSGDVLCVAGAGCLAADAATSITVAQHIRTCRAQSASRWNCY